MQEHGFKCWIAPRNVRPGRSYGDEFIRGIKTSHCLILVLSSESNQSIFVARKVERAVSKNKAVFPIRIENVEPASSLEFFISSTQWIDAFSGKLESHVDRLARLLAGEEGREIPAAALTQPSPTKKWRPSVIAARAVAVLAAAAVGFDSEAPPAIRPSTIRRASTSMATPP